MKKKPSGEESMDSASQDKLSYRSVFKLLGATHPVNKVRIDGLKNEMQRWQKEKELALSGMPAPTQYSIEDLIA